MSTATAEAPAPDTATAANPAPAQPITAAAVECFHQHGYTSAPALLPRIDADRYRAAALDYANAPERKAFSNNPVFTQLVNVWKDDAVLRELTFNPHILAAVRALAKGRPMRLWHDHLLIKRPHNGHASEFHQDQPYWSITRETFTISAWVALGDATMESGCMGFILDTFQERGLRAQNLSDANDLVSLMPDWRFRERVIVPLQSGGVTFHQGFCVHRAGENTTDRDRVAMSIIWVDADAEFNGAGHCVTDDLGLTPGMHLPDHRCPRVS
jgi:ectoine hydroxylase-related dioxygenase (phytanoyl-CoA dioxygenase family)